MWSLIRGAAVPGVLIFQDLLLIRGLRFTAMRASIYIPGSLSSFSQILSIITASRTFGKIYPHLLTTSLPLRPPKRRFLEI